MERQSTRPIQFLMLFFFVAGCTLAWLAVSATLEVLFAIILLPVIPKSLISGLITGLLIGGTQKFFIRNLLGLPLSGWVRMTCLAYTLIFFVSYQDVIPVPDNAIEIHAVLWYIVPTFMQWIILNFEVKWGWIWLVAGLIAGVIDVATIRLIEIDLPFIRTQWLSAQADIVFTLLMVAIIGRYTLQSDLHPIFDNLRWDEPERSITGFYLSWVGSAILVYPLAVAIPLTIHVFHNQIPITLNTIQPLAYWDSYSDKALVYMILFTVLLACTQMLLIKSVLKLPLDHWFRASFIGGLIGIFIIYRVDEPFVNSLGVAPWLFFWSAGQFLILRRHTTWAWLWIVGHLSIAGMFPVISNDSPLELLVKWGTAAGIAGGVTILIFRILLVKSLEDKQLQAVPKHEIS